MRETCNNNTTKSSFNTNNNNNNIKKWKYKKMEKIGVGDLDGYVVICRCIAWCQCCS